MLSEYELRERISSIGETQKITGAMYLIASSELHRAKDAFDSTAPYFKLLRTEIKRIFRSLGDVESRYMYPADGSRLSDGRYGILLITADKGLAGRYNMNAIGEAERAMKEHPDSRLYVVGSYGRKYFTAKNIPFVENFEFSAQSPTLHRARKIAAILLHDFIGGEIDKIFVIYSHCRNDAVIDVVNDRILPFHRGQFSDGTEPPESFKFFPSEKEVLESVAPSYVCGFVYSALTDSFLSEQRSRMSAMETADKSARDMLAELDFECNRLRQSEITREITEISAAARYQKQKKAEKTV